MRAIAPLVILLIGWTGHLLRDRWVPLAPLTYAPLWPCGLAALAAL